MRNLRCPVSPLYIPKDFVIVKKIGNLTVSFPSEEVMRRVLGEEKAGEEKEYDNKK